MDTAQHKRGVRRGGNLASPSMCKCVLNLKTRKLKRTEESELNKLFCSRYVLSVILSYSKFTLTSTACNILLLSISSFISDIDLSHICGNSTLYYQTPQVLVLMLYCIVKLSLYTYKTLMHVFLQADIFVGIPLSGTFLGRDRFLSFSTWQAVFQRAGEKPKKV